MADEHMAEGRMAEGRMAEEPHETSEPTGGVPLGGAHRTAPVIEGEVAETAAESSAVPDRPGEPADEGTDASAPERPVTTPEASPAPRRPSLWPVAAGLVLGALIAVAGAFGLSTYAAPPVDASLDTQLGALTARVAALARKPAPAPADPGGLARLEQRVAALDARVAAAETAATAAVGAAGDARTAAETTASAPAVAAPPPQADLGPLTERVEALAKRVAPLETALAETKTQIRATEDRDAAAQQGARAPALAVAAESLLRAVEQGSPYAAQLAVVETLGADPAQLSVLRPLAGTGLPGRMQLHAGLAPATAAATRAADPPSGGGIIDHLKESAARLVRVRKLGDPEGGDEGIAKVGARIDQGDVAGALALWDTLPAGPKAQSAAFAEAAKARLAALAAARAIEAQSVAALTKARS